MQPVRRCFKRKQTVFCRYWFNRSKTNRNQCYIANWNSSAQGIVQCERIQTNLGRANEYCISYNTIYFRKFKSLKHCILKIYHILFFRVLSIFLWLSSSSGEIVAQTILLFSLLNDLIVCFAFDSILRLRVCCFPPSSSL